MECLTVWDLRYEKGNEKGSGSIGEVVALQI